MPQPSVLVVDDDRSFVVACAILLRDAGFTALEAFSAEQALELMQRSKVDLVVMDVYMPQKSGIDLLAQIRANKLYLPIILISSNHSNDTVQKGIGVGANLFVPKPFDPEYLLQCIRDLLHMTHTRI